MSTHQDWEAAKARQDSAAYQLAKAYIFGNKAEVEKQTEKFKAAESDMIRIEAELGGQQ